MTYADPQTLTATPIRPALPRRLSFAPDAQRESPNAHIWAFLAPFLGLWAAAVMTFGLPGLYLPALALVPLAFVGLIVLSRP